MVISWGCRFFKTSAESVVGVMGVVVVMGVLGVGSIDYYFELTTIN